MKNLLLLLFIGLFATACNDGPPEQQILGKWDFYQFNYKKVPHFPEGKKRFVEQIYSGITYFFQPDHVLLAKHLNKDGKVLDSVVMRYAFSPDGQKMMLGKDAVDFSIHSGFLEISYVDIIGPTAIFKKQ